MQQRARDLDPAHLAAGQFARCIARAIRQLDVLQRRFSSAARIASADPVQCGMVEQVVHHREIEIERSRLEHDPSLRSASPGCAGDAVTQNVDRSSPRVVKPGDQGKQRCLAGAVQAKQRGKPPLRNDAG